MNLSTLSFEKNRIKWINRGKMTLQKSVELEFGGTVFTAARC